MKKRKKNLNPKIEDFNFNYEQENQDQDFNILKKSRPRR